MSELVDSIPEKLPRVREIRYPGCKTTLREITSAYPDVVAIKEINNALEPTEYAEVGDQTDEETRNWLNAGVTRRFESINPGSRRRAAVVTEEGQEYPAESMIVATKPLNETGKLTGYTYVYTSEDYAKLPEEVQRRYAANAAVDISYVTPAKDKDRNVVEISESLLQTSMMLWERSVGKSVDELNSELSSEQRATAQQNLSIFANASATESDTNYRKALGQAGFKEVHRYYEKEEESGEDVEYIVYTVSPEELSNVLKQKQETPPEPSISS